MAYGEEINVGVGSRTAGTNGNKYSSADDLKQKFTGYERDDESGLDYAQARYYNSQSGRFTSVDPLMASATIKNPQTFNRYTYALNSPYKFTDPLGLAAMNASCHPASREPVPCQRETEEASTVERQTASTNNQQGNSTTNSSDVPSSRVPPPPPLKPGTISIGLVEVFNKMPGDTPIRDTEYRAPGPKPTASTLPENGKANLTAPNADVVYVRVTATVTGDAQFTNTSLPTITSNSTNNAFTQTALPGQKTPSSELQAIKPQTELSEGGKVITVVFALQSNTSTQSSSTFTVGFTANSTQGLVETTLWNRQTNPTAKVSVTLNKPKQE